MAKITRVGVVGAGLMGSGIAEVCARSSLEVLVAEADPAALERGRERIATSLSEAVRRGKLQEDEREEVAANLAYTTELSDFADRELVFEVVAEVEAVKASVFGALDRFVESPDAIFASNTSSLSIARLSSATSRPTRVIGVHFFNPATVMPLVEVIPSLLTDPEVVEATMSFVRDDLGKTVILAKDRAGFTVNALLVPFLLAAMRMFETGVASAEEIDLGLEAGCGHPMGPLRLSDMLGLDTLKSIADSLYQEFKEPLYAPPPILSRLVEAGCFGKKTGRGFYLYP